MTVDPYRGVYAKIARAEQHLAHLHQQVTEYDKHGWRLKGDYDARLKRYTVSFDMPPPPIEWGVRVSEWAHLLRTALDNLVYIAVERNDKQPHRQSEFPVFETESKYLERKRKKRIEGRLRLDQEEWVDKMQPFENGELFSRFDPLFVLHKLNTFDKHQDLHASFATHLIRLPIWLPPGRKEWRFIAHERAKPLFGPWLKHNDFIPGLVPHPEPRTSPDVVQIVQWGWRRDEDRPSGDVLWYDLETRGDDVWMEVFGVYCHVSLGHQSFPVFIQDLLDAQRWVADLVQGFPK